MRISKLVGGKFSVIPVLLHLNYMLFQEINGPAGRYPWLDAFMAFSANWLIFFFPLLLLAIWGRPLRWRHRSLNADEEIFIQQRRAAVLWIGVASILSYAINLSIEQFVFEPRPFVSYRVHLLISHAADSSFPSDHTAWAFAVVGVLLFQLLPVSFSLWRKQDGTWLGAKFTLLVMPLLFLIIAFVVAFTIGFARVFVGVHYPGDVLAGAIVGLIAATIVTLLANWLRRPTNAVIRFAYTLHLA